MQIFSCLRIVEGVKFALAAKILYASGFTACAPHRVATVLLVSNGSSHSREEILADVTKETNPSHAEQTGKRVSVSGNHHGLTMDFGPRLANLLLGHESVGASLAMEKVIVLKSGLDKKF
jgi:hypothetical protein